VEVLSRAMENLKNFFHSENMTNVHGIVHTIIQLKHLKMNKNVV